MKIRSTFSAYVSRQFLFWFAAVLFVLVGLIFLFDTIELLRRTATEGGASLGVVITMALFKLPHMGQKAILFAVLFGGMMAFWRLNRYYELVVARASGISAWQLLMPVVIIAALIGAVKTTLISPFSSTLLLRFERIEAKHIKRKASLAALSSEGIWLRQTTEDGHYMLHADTIRPQQMELRKVIIFFFRDNDKFVQRIDAPSAQLKRGRWELSNARITAPNAAPDLRQTHRVSTVLTRKNIQDSFAPPETMSFWALPAFIDVLDQAGFSGLRHRLYWNSQLADPLLLCAMVLLAAIFTLRPLRRGGTVRIIAGGVATGFLIYFVTDVVYALGLSARIPTLLAAWSPAVVSSLLGAALLFHVEDG